MPKVLKSGVKRALVIGKQHNVCESGRDALARVA
jgi:hypothetical protein